MKYANLRVCASCEWIFKNDSVENGVCPKCEFISYGARYVYGNICYRYAISQKPWKEKKITDYILKLNDEIRKENNERQLLSSALIHMKHRLGNKDAEVKRNE